MAPACPATAATRAADTKTDEDRDLDLTAAWVGSRPAWLDLDEAKAELDGVELSDEGATPPPEIMLVAREALGALPDLRRTLRGSVIALDLTGDGDTELTLQELGRARAADAVLAGSRSELGEIWRRLPAPRPRMGVVPRPLDLDWYAPEGRLAEAKGRGRDLRRFRRFHRLAGPTILFAGPYSEAGGLDLLIEAVFRLRERIPDLRLAAIPHGATDPQYRDRCEMRILGLGHRGIVEWTPLDSEVPFWYATAAVVCAPSREARSPEPAKCTAAAARPFVGSDHEQHREHVDDGETGRLVPTGDLDALETTLEALLVSEDEAVRLGEAARRKAETEYSPAAAARSLSRVLETLVRTGGEPS
jgi:glycosyltransferase involved in cell wall biosynthesis